MDDPKGIFGHRMGLQLAAVAFASSLSTPVDAADGQRASYIKPPPEGIAVCLSEAALRSYMTLPFESRHLDQNIQKNRAEGYDCYLQKPQAELRIRAIEDVSVDDSPHFVKVLIWFGMQPDKDWDGYIAASDIR